MEVQSAALEQPAVVEDSAAPVGQAASEAEGIPPPEDGQDESSKGKDKLDKPKKIPQCQVGCV